METEGENGFKNRESNNNIAENREREIIKRK